MNSNFTNNNCTEFGGDIHALSVANISIINSSFSIISNLSLYVRSIGNIDLTTTNFTGLLTNSPQNQAISIDSFGSLNVKNCIFSNLTGSNGAAIEFTNFISTLSTAAVTFT